MKKLLIISALILLSSCMSVQERHRQEKLARFQRAEQRELIMINAIDYCKDLRHTDNGLISSPFRKCVIENSIKAGY